jgi:hypothetical protein
VFSDGGCNCFCSCDNLIRLIRLVIWNHLVWRLCACFGRANWVGMVGVEVKHGAWQLRSIAAATTSVGNRMLVSLRGGGGELGN